MAEILIVGGGVVGLGLGMMLAHDDHAVTVLERDSQPPPEDADEAWNGWERKGVNQFRLPHLFLCRYRQILEAECPRWPPPWIATGPCGSIRSPTPPIS